MSAADHQDSQGIVDIITSAVDGDASFWMPFCRSLLMFNGSAMDVQEIAEASCLKAGPASLPITTPMSLLAPKASITLSRG